MKNQKITIRVLPLLLSLLLLAGLLSGCASTKPEAPETTTSPLTACPEPRPELCTMNYLPVCGEHKDGSHKTYSNGCNACSDPAVVGHRPGECK